MTQQTAATISISVNHLSDLAVLEVISIFIAGLGFIIAAISSGGFIIVGMGLIILAFVKVFKISINK